MDRVAVLAREFRKRNPETLEILRAFHSQYDDIVVVPFERDKQQGRGRGGLRKTFRPEAGEIYFNTKNFHYILKNSGPQPTSTARKIKSKTIFNISLGDSAAISLHDVIDALRVCENNEWAVPFRSEVLGDALNAFEALDKEAIYEQSHEIKEELRLYELTVEANADFEVVENEIDPVRETEDQLKNTSLKIFKFLVNRTRKTTYSTLLGEVWEKSVQDDAVKRAIERLAEKLNDMKPQHFEVENEYGSRRVALNKLAPTSDAEDK